MTNDYTAELVLAIPDNSTASFECIIIVTKEMFFDFEEKIEFKVGNEMLQNLWGSNFVKEFVSPRLIEWLKDKDFYMSVVPIKNSSSIRTLHFSNEEDRLHYILKFNNS